MAQQNTRYAVVTGANKGIGFGIAKLLAANGIVVILTARDEKRGLEAVKKLKDSGLSDFVLFHQLDVVDSASVANLAEFIKSKFGKLDILVNNAGISGVITDVDALKANIQRNGEAGKIDWSTVSTQTYELSKECITINYYGVKRVTEALVPLLQLSKSPRIVNISSSMSKLEKVPYKWAKDALADIERLSEERIDEIISRSLEDFRRGSPPDSVSYILSKASLNAYTRIQAKKYPNFRINCIYPGYVRTDMNFNTGTLSIDEGAESPVALAFLPDDGPSGYLFSGKEKTTF